MTASREMVASFASRDPFPCLFHSLTSSFFFFSFFLFLFQESTSLPLNQNMAPIKYSTTTTVIMFELKTARNIGPEPSG